MRIMVLIQADLCICIIIIIFFFLRAALTVQTRCST